MPDETEVPTAQSLPPADLTLAQAMAAKRSDAESVVSRLEAELAAARAEVASIIARVESIPASFHSMSVKEIWAHIEGWFK